MTIQQATEQVTRALVYVDETGASAEQVMVGETGLSVLDLLMKADIELDDVRNVPSGAMYRLAQLMAKA